MAKSTLMSVVVKHGCWGHGIKWMADATSVKINDIS